MLTPAEFKKKELIERKKRFYDKEEVDTLLQELSANYEELYTKYETMTANAKKLSDGVQYYKSIETTLQKALVLAEKTAKDTKEAAEANAQKIEAEANEKAKQILIDAEKECEDVKAKCNHLVDLFKQYKSQFIQVTSNNLQLLNSKEFDIDAPELEEMYAKQKPETEIGLKKQLENTQDLVAVISSNLANPSIASPVPAVEENATEIEAAKEEVESEVQPPKMQYKDADTSSEAVQTSTQESEVLSVQQEPEIETIKEEPVKEEKAQTLDALLNDLNMNNKKQDDEDPFEFLGSLDDF